MNQPPERPDPRRAARVPFLPFLASNALAVGALVFLLALFGILTRPMGLLSAFWPANAVLLGLFVRSPRRANLAGWGGALVGYVLADLATGSTWGKTLLLTTANLVGIASGYLFYRRVPEAHRLLKQPQSVIYLILVVLVASTAAGLVGMVANPLLFRGTPLSGLSHWFAAELVNYLAILPVVLTLPVWRRPWHDLRRGGLPVLPHAPYRYAPVLALVCGLWLGMVVSGPGALVYLLPGLLWCALSYSVFVTALLTLLASMWTLLAVSTGYLQLAANALDPKVLQSLRIGVTLVALAPLTVASVMAARNALLQQLQHAATHDPLTGVLNRGGFSQRAALLFSQQVAAGRPLATLMLDIDHFKAINDAHGHPAGDRVLAGFARLVADCLRESDVLGRMGGEEFSILLPDCSPQLAQAIAQRICDTVAGHSFTLEGGAQLQVTVSVGVAHAVAASASQDALLQRADNALYQAKQAGRNRVVAAAA